MKLKICGVLSLAWTTFAWNAHATPILGNGLPEQDIALLGGNVIDFETVGSFNGLSLNVDEVTFTGNGNILVTSAYAGLYNTRGQYNLTNRGSLPSEYRFDFSRPVDAFGFLFGASDVTWTLQAFSNFGLLDTLLINPTRGSNAGDYFGIAADSIAYATLTAARANDYIFIDNFAYTLADDGTTAVPEPGTMALMSLGVLSIGWSQRKAMRR